MQVVRLFAMHLLVVLNAWNITSSMVHLWLQGSLPILAWVLLPFQIAIVLDMLCILWFRGMVLIVFSSPFPSARLRAYSAYHIFQLRKCHYCHSLAKAQFMHIGFPYGDPSLMKTVHLCKHHFLATMLKLKMENMEIEEDPNLPKWWASVPKELSPKEKLHAS